MLYKPSTHKLVSTTIATLAGAVLCALFAVVLLATGALAA